MTDQASSTQPYGFYARHRNDIDNATYFIIEANEDFVGRPAISTIEEADDAGYFRIQAGFPDRPANRDVYETSDFGEALGALHWLRQRRPGVPAWLSTAEVTAKIEGENTWRGVVEARASLDPSDEWGELAWSLDHFEERGEVICFFDDAPAYFLALQSHL